MMAAHSSNSLLLTDLLEGFVDLSTIGDYEIFGLSIDSREVSPGDCFIALKGANNNGARFAAAAIAAGACAVLIEDDNIPIATTVPVVCVPKLAEVVGHIASRFYGAPSESLAVIAVTGTNGKTTIAQLCAQALETLHGSAGYVGTLGHGLVGDLAETSHTTPDPIALQHVFSKLCEQQCRSVSLEVSSHAIHQCRVVGTAIDIGIFTNVGHDHLDYHQTRSNYANVKKSLFHYPGIRHAIVNIDDPIGRQLLTEIPSHVATWTYGDKGTANEINPERHFTLISARTENNQQTFNVETPSELVELSTRLLGEFNLYNTIAALAALTALGIDAPTAARALSQVNGVAGRMQRIDSESDGGPIVVVDYAHTPESLALVLSVLRKEANGRLTCVFGCGGDRDKSKRRPMGLAAEEGADRVIVTSDNPRGESVEDIARDIFRGAGESPKHELVHDRGAAIRRAISEASSEDIVLIAGKGHENYQVIDGKRSPFSDVDVARRILAETFK